MSKKIKIIGAGPTGLFTAFHLSQKTNFDIEMIQELGYCTGIENYSRYFDGRKKNERPFCLIDYFPKYLKDLIG